MLIEGTDYYIENGKWVFTAHFLSKRGYCCLNNCKYCPYKSMNANVKPGKYIWKSKTADMPVTVIESLGKGSDGRTYVKIENSNTAVPIDELKQVSESSKPTPKRLF